MSLYRRGRRYEWKARQSLEQRGYFVIRAAGSKGPVDLAAFPLGFSGPVRLIQVKAGPRRPGPAAYRELAAMNVVASKELWWFPPRSDVEIIAVP